MKPPCPFADTATLFIHLPRGMNLVPVTPYEPELPGTGRVEGPDPTPSRPVPPRNPDYTSVLYAYRPVADYSAAYINNTPPVKLRKKGLHNIFPSSPAMHGLCW